MPEIIRNRDHAQGLLHIVADAKVVPSYLQRDGMILGAGEDNIVFEAPHDTEKVYAVTYNNGIDREQAKTGFYAHKMLSTLFPYNFPRIHAAYCYEFRTSQTTFQRNLSGTVRERIAHQRGESVIKHSIGVVKTFFEDMGTKIEEVLDHKADNFIVGTDGGEYYSDIIRTTNRIANFSPDKVTEWMKSHKVSDKKTAEEREYSAQEISLVMKSLRRLQDLSPFYRGRSTFSEYDDGEET